jgi:hypothetical protein
VVVAVLIAVIFSVLTSCASAGSSGGVQPDPAATAAEQLAADINAAKAGSAKTGGGTVTLSGEVGYGWHIH